MLAMPDWDNALQRQNHLLLMEAAEQLRWRQDGSTDAVPEKYAAAAAYLASALHLYRERLPALMRQIADDLEAQGVDDPFDQAVHLRSNNPCGLDF